MQSIDYIQRYKVEDKKPFKVVCLALCILLDLIVLSGVIACLTTKNYFDLMYYGVILVIDFAIRVLTPFMTDEVIIAIGNNNVKIIKKYPIEKVVIYDGDASNLKLKRCDGKEKNDNFEQCSRSGGEKRECVEQRSRSCKDSKKYVRLCSKSCEEDVYMVELLEKKYLIYLQDYTFSLIEVSSDLS